MSIELYKCKQEKVLAGVLAGLAHKLGWEVWLVRGLFLASLLIGRASLLTLVFYIAGAYLLPYKEEQDAERYGMGPRKIKDAEKIRKNWF
ncbi:PspC domain-containing protein [Streptococcus suis]